MVVSTDPTFANFLLFKLSKVAARRERQVSFRVSAVLNTTVRLLLHLAGFSLLTIAAWQWDLIAGLCAAGVSCFLLSTLLTRSPNDGSDENVRRAPDLRTGR